MTITKRDITAIVFIFAVVHLTKKRRKKMSRNDFTVPKFMRSNESELAKQQKKSIKKLLVTDIKKHAPVYNDLDEYDEFEETAEYYEDEEYEYDYSSDYVEGDTEENSLMTAAEKKALAEIVQGYTLEELKIVLDNIPVNLCLERVRSEIEELQEFKRSVEDAFSGLNVMKK